MDEKKGYMCNTCKGTSETLGVCETEGCVDKGRALSECTCGEGSCTCETPASKEPAVEIPVAETPVVEEPTDDTGVV